MDLNKSMGGELKGLNGEMFSVNCETAVKQFQIILTSKLNEFLPEKTANQRSEKTWIDNRTKNAATKKMH